MYYLESSGSWFEIGRNHGRRLSREIRQAFAEWAAERYLAPEAAEYGSESRGYTSEHYADLMEEMSGIADGCGMSLDEVFALSAFNSLAKTQSGCTAMAIRGEDGRAVVGKTHDIGVVEQRWSLVHLIRPPGAMPMIRAGSVGSVWAVAGINQGGLGMGAASGPTFAGQTGCGLPQHCVAAPALSQCATVAEVEGMMDHMVLAGRGINAVYGDASGDAAVVEKSFDRQAIRRNAEGPVFTTNHALGETMRGHLPQSEALLRNSSGRFSALPALLAPGTFADPVAKMKEVLSFREGPAPICQAGDVLTTRTVYLADGGKGRLYACPTAPTPDSFICFEL